MHLSADSIDELAVGVHALDEADHSCRDDEVNDTLRIIEMSRNTPWTLALFESRL